MPSWLAYADGPCAPGVAKFASRSSRAVRISPVNSPPKRSRVTVAACSGPPASLCLAVNEAHAALGGLILEIGEQLELDGCPLRVVLGPPPQDILGLWLKIHLYERSFRPARANQPG